MNDPARLSPASLEAELRERAEAFARAARRVHESTDEEAVHDLRVSARRLIASLDLWRHVLTEEPRRRALRACRRLRRRLGRGREHEVHAAMLAERVATAEVATRIAGNELLARVRRKRDRARRRAARRIDPHRIQRVMVHVAAAHAGLGRQAAFGQDALRLAIARCSEHERRGRATIGQAVEQPIDRSLHAARIAVKKWRYSLEALRFVRGRGPTEIPAQHRPAGRLAFLRKLQHVLGEIQDRSTLLAVLAKEVRRLEQRGLDENAAALRVLTQGIEREREEAVARFRALAGELSRVGGSPQPPGLLLRIPDRDSRTSSTGS